MPDLLLRRLSQVVLISFPKGVNAPIPVITTLFMAIYISTRGLESRKSIENF
jgi:hypothetical protein